MKTYSYEHKENSECILVNSNFLDFDFDREFSLIVTSPPYADMRTYEGDESTCIHPDDYVEWFTPYLEKIHSLLVPDGNFVLNINEQIVNGEVHPYVDDLKRRAREIGLRQISKPYIWYKTTAPPNACTKRAYDRYEYCFWFSNGSGTYHKEHTRVPYKEISIKRAEGKVNPLNLRGVKGSTEKKQGYVSEKGALAHNVLEMPIECNSKIKHAAPFYVDLPRWFIKAGTLPGQWVLDPFMGSGTTAVAALEEGRNVMGTELIEKYWNFSCERIEEKFSKKTKDLF